MIWEPSVSRTTARHARALGARLLVPCGRTVEGRGMASDAEQRRSDRILNFLVSKGLHGCPVCAQGRFSVGPEHVIISTPDPDMAEGAPVEGSAVGPAVCGKWGHTMRFGTRKSPIPGE